MFQWSAHLWCIVSVPVLHMLQVYKLGEGKHYSATIATVTVLWCQVQKTSVNSYLIEINVSPLQTQMTWISVCPPWEFTSSLTGYSQQKHCINKQSDMTCVRNLTQVDTILDSDHLYNIKYKYLLIYCNVTFFYKK